MTSQTLDQELINSHVNSEMMMEFRIRTIYALKSLVYSHLKDGHCS